MMSEEMSAFRDCNDGLVKEGDNAISLLKVSRQHIGKLVSLSDTGSLLVSLHLGD